MVINLLLLIIFIILCIHLAYETEKPCWCSTLKSRIFESHTRLCDRYGEAALNRSTIYSSSGKSNPIEHRLMRALYHGKPFYIGVIGGSYSLQQGFSGNAWSFNVSRWLDWMLSSHESCESEYGESSYKSNVLNSSDSLCSSSYQLLERNYTPCGFTNLTTSPSIFCSKFVNVKEELSYHRTQRDLDLVCNNAVKPFRSCQVFGGSGKYSRLVIGGKGGTTSKYGKWTIQNLGEENIDFLIWDYSINDIHWIKDHIYLFYGLFDQALAHYPSIGGFGVVYWQSRALCDINTNTTVWENDLATIDYPLLKKFFEPEFGKYQNKTLITVSLSRYCKNAREQCSIDDFIDLNQKHQSDQGVSTFADLFIWQLLGLLKKIFKKSCDNPRPIQSGLFYSSHIKMRPWIRDNFKTENVSAYLQPYRDQLYAQTANLNDIKTPTSWIVEASLIFNTPIVSSPPPIEDFALLCAPSTQSVVLDQVYNVFEVDKLPRVLNWQSVDIVSIINNKCAGWHHAGKRMKNRIDDEHYYSPISSINCPHGNAVRDGCETNFSSPFYPHKGWPKLSLVKAVDLAFRISMNIKWERVCFLECQPIILWQTRLKDTQGSKYWHQAPLKKVRNGPAELGPCYLNPFLRKFADISYDEKYVLWWPADSCLPVRHLNNMSRGSVGFIVNTPMLLIRPVVLKTI